jgi:hypothetical protein
VEEENDTKEDKCTKNRKQKSFPHRRRAKKDRNK